MRSVLFTIGPFPVFSFGFMVAAGLALTFWLISFQYPRGGFRSKDEAGDLVLIAVASGFVGARIYYVLQNFSYYRTHLLEIFAVWEGGLIFYGGLIAATLVLWGHSKKSGRSFWRSMDFLAPYGALTHSMGRIGCFLNGCCHGRICDLPWAVKFEQTEGPVHPVQLYEAVLNLGIFFLLNFFYPRRRFDGQIILLYFMSYSMVRFVMEFFRDNPAWGLFTANQWISTAFFVLALGLHTILGRPCREKA